MYKYSPIKRNQRVKPVYNIVFKYRIGDGYGNITRTGSIPKDYFYEDQQLHLYALQKFSQLKIEGRYWVAFDIDHLRLAYKQDLLSYEEFYIILSEIAAAYYADRYYGEHYTYDDLLRDWDLGIDIDLEKLFDADTYFSDMLEQENDLGYRCYIEDICLKYTDKDGDVHEVYWEDE